MLDIYNQIQNIKSLEIGFIDNKGTSHKLVCTVKFVDNEYLILIANNQQNNHVFAKAGNELNVCIFTEMGVFTAVSKVVQVFEGVVNSEYIITYPEKSRHFQRREYFRVSMSVDTNITIIRDSPDLSDLIIHSKTKNICGKGMSCLCEQLIPDYAVIVVELLFSERVITTLAAPIYNKKINIYDQSKVINGFSFLDITKKDIDFIVKKCFLHQLEQRKII